MNKKIIRILKNFLINIFWILWILMFLRLWSLEDMHLLRLCASFFAALLLAVFEVLFEEKEV